MFIYELKKDFSQLKMVAMVKIINWVYFKDSYIF